MDLVLEPAAIGAPFNKALLHNWTRRTWQNKILNTLRYFQNRTQFARVDDRPRCIGVALLYIYIGRCRRRQQHSNYIVGLLLLCTVKLNAFDILDYRSWADFFSRVR